MVELSGISKSFSTPGGRLGVLSGFSLSVADGAFLGIRGESGAGKSTLLSIVASLQRPDSGSVVVGGRDVWSLSEGELCAFRNECVGFVSQERSLLENLTVAENVALPALLSRRRVPDGEAYARAESLLSELGLSALSSAYPRSLSGGEAHRVLIARALMNDPALIAADEPTGSVSARQAAEIARIFRRLSEEGRTVVMVSHDSAVLAECSEVVELRRPDAE